MSHLMLRYCSTPDKTGNAFVHQMKGGAYLHNHLALFHYMISLKPILLSNIQSNIISKCGHQVRQVGFLRVLRFPPTPRAHERNHR